MIATMSKDNFKNELVDLLGEDGNFAVALRGMYADELNTIDLKPSRSACEGEWDDGYLSGTSSIGIVGHYGDASGKDLRVGFEKAWELVQKYGDSDVSCCCRRFDG